jgi:hypothetical protein
MARVARLRRLIDAVLTDCVLASNRLSSGACVKPIIGESLDKLGLRLGFSGHGGVRRTSDLSLTVPAGAHHAGRSHHAPARRCLTARQEVRTLLDDSRSTSAAGAVRLPAAQGLALRDHLLETYEIPDT